ncbi:MAG: transposase [Clostridia bacterium]|nr:transposase [Clostridia bacterium]
MENNEKKPSYQLLVLIATPKLADKAAELFCRNSLPVQYRLNAEGTASNEIMDMLGFGSIDKCILASMVEKPLGQKMLGKLHSELRLDTVNSGIAFTIPLTGASNLILRMLTQTAENTAGSAGGKERYIMTDIKYSLITAVVNRGFSGDVMKAAKEAGAGGGTVMHSRSIVNEEALGFNELSVPDEKEIVLIIAEAESKMAIMRAISENCGMASEAKGLVVSLPIDSVMGI